MPAPVDAPNRRRRSRGCGALDNRVFESDPVAALAIPLLFGSAATAGFAWVDDEVARLLAGHELLPIDLQRYRLAESAHWTCPSLAFALAGGLTETTAPAVTAATAVTLLRIMVDHHVSVPRRPPPEAGARERRDLGATLMTGDLVMSRIAHLAGTAGGEVGNALLAVFVSFTANMVCDRAAPYTRHRQRPIAQEGALVDHPLVNATLAISRMCGQR